MEKCRKHRKQRKTSETTENVGKQQKMSETSELELVEIWYMTNTTSTSTHNIMPGTPRREYNVVEGYQTGWGGAGTGLRPNENDGPRK